MLIGGKNYAVGEIVPDDVVKAANPDFYTAVEAARVNEFSSAAMDLAAPFTMLGAVLGDRDAKYDYEAEQKRIKAAAKKGEILCFGGKYLANEALRGKLFVAKCNGLARKRHPEADEAIRMQDAQYSYNAECSMLYTREVK